MYTLTTFKLTTFKQDVKVSLADKLEYGEIYTPFALIEQMLDLFAPAVFQDPSKTWFDVGAGQGYFSMCVFARLNTGLAVCMPDETVRKTHIVEKMLYMLELKPSNVAALRAMFGDRANIIAADFLDYNEHHLLYDYIIGNPPYNAHGLKKVPTNKVRDKKKDGTTVWAKFIDKSLTLLQSTTGQLCMIVPALWLKPDKSGLHQRLTRYTLEKIRCFSSNETNTLFKGAAQTPTCFFLLTNVAGPEPQTIQLYDNLRQTYVPFTHRRDCPLPMFGAQLIEHLQPWLAQAGSVAVEKTNMPPKKSRFGETYTCETYPYANITTCVLDGLESRLVVNYSDTPQAFYGQKKLVLAHKMYGLPYWDKDGHYGIANRDNYVILRPTDAELAQLAAFLSTNFVRYLFEAGRYRMKCLEKYVFEFIPDITRLSGFPQEITDDSVATFFGLDAATKNHIMCQKNYGRFF